MKPSSVWAALFVAVVGIGSTACGVHGADLSRPNGVAVASNGDVYIMDRGHYRVARSSEDGYLLGVFGQLGTAPSQIYSGWDIALDGAMYVYLCNQVRDDNGYLIHDGVKVFTPEGGFVRELGGQRYAPDAGSRVRKVYGLDTDKRNRIYVADYGTNTVRVFDRQGWQIAEFFGESGIGPGEFDGLNDVAVDDPRGYLYAVDNVNSRVQQFRMSLTDSGELTVTHRLTFGSYGQEAGQFAYPQYGVVNDRTGWLYVGDTANRRIQYFDSDGEYLGEFYPPDVKEWQVMGLAVSEDGAIYAADAYNDVVWVFEADGPLRRRIGGGS